MWSVSPVLESLLVFFSAVFLYYYLYYKHCFNYWKKWNLPTATPRFPFGSLGVSALGQQSVFIRLQDLYNNFKAKGHIHAGIYFFNGPIYLPIHPDLVKKILVPDFNYFVERGMYENSKLLPLSSHIFSMKEAQWRDIRTKISPSFTAGKMKNMFGILLKNGEDLVETLQLQSGKEVNMKEFLLRYSADVIGSTSFGIDANSLKNPNSEFSKMVHDVSSHSGWKMLKLALQEGLQNPGNIEKIAYDNKVIERYFTDLVKDTIDYRDRNKIVRNDFLNTLMNLREFGISFKEIVAQSYLFFIAGFKTSAFTMCYCIHELTHNQVIQDRLRREIHENLGSDCAKYSYQELMSLPYLDMVVRGAPIF